MCITTTYRELKTTVLYIIFTVQYVVTTTTLPYSRRKTRQIENTASSLPFMIETGLRIARSHTEKIQSHNFVIDSAGRKLFSKSWHKDPWIRFALLLFL